MIELIGKELRQFYNFISYPTRLLQKQDLSVKGALALLLSYYAIFIVGMIVLAPFAAIAGLEEIPHKLEELTNMNKWFVLLLAVFTQPILEELFFRWPLKYRRPLLILILTMLSMVVFLVLTQWLEQEHATMIAVGFGIVSIIISLFVFGSQKSQEKLGNWIDRYFPHLFYAVVVYFAFVHFFNFELSGGLWIYVPIMVFPQFLIALFLGYARLQHGLLAAIMIHMFNNLIPTLVLVFVDPETLMGLIG